PNHMLEQFAREFMMLYPNARLLVASKEDMTRDRRKQLTARIASGEWDGIIVTHSSFERIGMSSDYQSQFLREQIAEYDRLLTDTARADAKGRHRNLIKTIEKQKAAREAKLTELAAEGKKDDGLVFDELGVDHVFIDEAHFFKNLETPTKMDRVAGIQTSGSQRAFDIYMKARYLGRQHEGHGVTFATGTPISNTMVELYNLQRFLDPQGLAQRGIEHFDGWASTFGEVVESMEISPDGKSLRPRSRFARFNNLPELQQMFHTFADVQTADMLKLPVPKLKDGKPMTISCPMSDQQAALQDELVERYEKLRSQKVDPRVDNALAITTDGRKLALEARLLSAEATDHADSKIHALVDNVARIWRETSPTRGAQMIFCDMGVNHTPWGYSVYQDITRQLIARGIPAEQIADIGSADTDGKKQALFEKVRQGSVRVLLGSTQKMGTGTNVQKRLVALHHLDAPWKPAEVEQRDGRILRQGNENPEVAIYRYVTEGSFDAYMWQALETKARFISQVMTGHTTTRRAEDIGGQELSFAEVKAIASGNPAVLTLAEADAELQRLTLLQKGHMDEQFLIRRKLQELPATINQLKERRHGIKSDIDTLSSHGTRPIDPHTLADKLERLPQHVGRFQQIDLGHYGGLTYGITLYPHSHPEIYLRGETTSVCSTSSDRPGARAVINGVVRIVGGLPAQFESLGERLQLSLKQQRDYEARIGQPFEYAAYLKQLGELRDQLRLALSDRKPSEHEQPLPTAAQLSDAIKSLLSNHQHDIPAERGEQAPHATAEEPVTSLIKRHLQESAAPLGTIDDAALDVTAPSAAKPNIVTFERPETSKPPETSHPSFCEQLARPKPQYQLSFF
ncbi:MAG: hypothetical protein KDA99_11120, partial [Planctomycetales bacterium]|nr:hypothetical protein [Planctomycetales bacterium]